MKGTHGLLTIRDCAGKDAYGNYLWICQCQCGRMVCVRGSDLRRNQIKSCGCLRARFLTRFRWGDMTKEEMAARDEEIVKLRLSGQKMREIAQRYLITRQRVEQILKKMKGKS